MSEVASLAQQKRVKKFRKLRAELADLMASHTEFTDLLTIYAEDLEALGNDLDGSLSRRDADALTIALSLLVWEAEGLELEGKPAESVVAFLLVSLRELIVS